MADVTKEQVANYLKDLVGAYGPSPSIIDATIFTRSSSSPVTPADAIRVFGADNWNGVMTAYGRYLAVIKNPPKSEEPPKPKDSTVSTPIIQAKSIPEQTYHGYYSRQYLLQSLIDMYDEFDGHFTVQKVRDRAKRTPTPSYTVLSEYFGTPKNWAKIVENEKISP